MTTQTQALIDTRREQMFPKLEPKEIERLRRFGEPRSFETGDCLMKAGEVPEGLFVILSGEVAVTKPDPLGGQRQPIVSHTQGSFHGELAQLSGRPSLVDA